MMSAPDLSDCHICVIDGSNMLHRAWAMSPRQAGPEGQEIGATNLFSKMLAKMMRRMFEGRFPPTHVAIFFDPSREKSWRREVFPGYKADRPDMDPDLAGQIHLMQQVCEAMGIAWACAVKHEADDLVAAYVEDVAGAGGRCSILSTDKDLMQLVRPRVLQLNSVQEKWFTVDEVVKKFGVPPDRLGDFLALAGDKVDGVPGAPGIGPKSAVALIEEFGSLGGILRNAEKIERKSWRRSILENKEILRISRMLVSLDHAGAPRPLMMNAMTAPAPGRMQSGLQDWRATMGL